VTTLVSQGQVLWDRLHTLLDCLETAIDGMGSPTPCMTAVFPGAQVAIDYCNPCGPDQCGMAWVRLASVFPSTVFPIQDATSTPCPPPMAVTVDIGIARCAPVGDDDGNPPSTDEWEAASAVQIADMTAIQDAVLCCFTGKKVVFGAYQPLGPEGGCVGGVWTVAVDPMSW
jgi:hypothetical protein